MNESGRRCVLGGIPTLERGNDQTIKLQRVIVSIGNDVVMDTTLWSAFNRLKQVFLKDAAQTRKNIGVKNIDRSHAPALIIPPLQR